nr:YdeI/OmpD-associated family protein [Maliibacterium massiliense]
MPAYLQFASPEAFRAWLQANGASSEGVWLLFGKAGGPRTLKASEALEEALCYGWIDGQMRRVDDCAYIKYFSMRRARSKWSEKNKSIAARLEKEGRMTDAGRAKIREAKEGGQWDAVRPPGVTQEQVDALSALLRQYALAFTHFTAMSPSVQRTYARAYFDAKTERGRAQRLSWMVARLEQNLKPM